MIWFPTDRIITQKGRYSIIAFNSIIVPLKPPPPARILGVIWSKKWERKNYWNRRNCVSRIVDQAEKVDLGNRFVVEEGKQVVAAEFPDGIAVQPPAVAWVVNAVFVVDQIAGRICALGGETERVFVADAGNLLSGAGDAAEAEDLAVGVVFVTGGHGAVALGEGGDVAVAVVAVEVNRVALGHGLDHQQAAHAARPGAGAAQVEAPGVGALHGVGAVEFGHALQAVIDVADGGRAGGHLLPLEQASAPVVGEGDGGGRAGGALELHEPVFGVPGVGPTAVGGLVAVVVVGDRFGGRREEQVAGLGGAAGNVD